MPLTPILHDLSVLLAQSNPVQLCRTPQPSIPYRLHRLKIPNPSQTSRIHKSFPILARILR